MPDFPTDEETALWIALNRSQQKLYRTVDAALKAEGLPPLRWYDVLWSLERAGSEGGRAFELERSLLFEQSNLSRLLSRIIAEGLAEETVYHKDRRGKKLLITAEGRRVRKRMWTIYGPLIHTFMNGVAERDTKRLAIALGALADID